MVLTVTADVTGRVTEKPLSGCDGRRRERRSRRRSRRLVSVRGGGYGCGPIQELDVLVELWVVRRGDGEGCGRALHAADERVDQERPGHGLLGDGGRRYRRTGAFHRWPGKDARHGGASGRVAGRIAKGCATRRRRRSVHLDIFAVESGDIPFRSVRVDWRKTRKIYDESTYDSVFKWQNVNILLCTISTLLLLKERRGPYGDQR